MLSRLMDIAIERVQSSTTYAMMDDPSFTDYRFPKCTSHMPILDRLFISSKYLISEILASVEAPIVWKTDVTAWGR